MNLFEKISLVSKIAQVVKDLKTLSEENNPVVDEIKKRVDLVIEALKSLSELLPSVGELVDKIIEIFKK